MKKSFLVIGLGRFGSVIANILAENNDNVIAIDKKPELVSALADTVPHCLVADGTNLEALKELGAEKVDHAVIAIGNSLQSSVLSLINLKKLGIPMITVRADEMSHVEVFTALGANEVIVPEQVSAISLANQILSDSVLDYYGISDNHAMVQISVGKSFVPVSLRDMQVRQKYEVNIIGFIRDGEFTLAGANDIMAPGEIVVAVGTKKKLFEFDNVLNNETGNKTAHAPEFIKKRKK